MPLINQQPAQLNIISGAGSPLVVDFEISAVDGSGQPIPWDDFTAPAVIITGTRPSIPDAALPTVTSPLSGVFAVAWTGEQTALFTPNTPYWWALQSEISSEGPYPFVGGKLTLAQAVTPRLPLALLSTTDPLTVSVGGVTLTVTASIGGIEEVVIDGGDASSVYPYFSDIDGGSASSAYSTDQVLDGGNA